MVIDNEARNRRLSKVAGTPQASRLKQITRHGTPKAQMQLQGCTVTIFNSGKRCAEPTVGNRARCKDHL